MSLTVPPVLSALWRSSTGAILVALQVAITLAVLVNAAWVVGQRIRKVEQPTGLDIRDTFGMIIGGVSNQFNVGRAQSEDLVYLRTLPGVASATVTIGIPLTGMGSSYRGLWREPGQHGNEATTNVLAADEQTLRTLDVPLVAGRNFKPDEIRLFSAHKDSRPASEIVLTRALARALFPRSAALGRTVYDQASNPFTIIGITRNFMGAVSDPSVPVYHTALLPIWPGVAGYYALLVRTAPGRRASILRAAQRHIGASHLNGVIAATTTLSAAKRAFETNNLNIAIFLTIVTALMLAVCCLGVFGLATFNVASRTRQIGTRRALGARKRDIVAHFMIESALILAVGIALGSVLALAISDWLTTHYGLPRLDPAYLFGGVLVLSAIGQLAAWQPARKAARIPPSVATRTV